MSKPITEQMIENLTEVVTHFATQSQHRRLNDDELDAYRAAKLRLDEFVASRQTNVGDY